jgi:hypothetical protein
VEEPSGPTFGNRVSWVNPYDYVILCLFHKFNFGTLKA